MIWRHSDVANNGEPCGEPLVNHWNHFPSKLSALYISTLWLKHVEIIPFESNSSSKSNLLFSLKSRHAYDVIVTSLSKVSIVFISLNWLKCRIFQNTLFVLQFCCYISIDYCFFYVKCPNLVWFSFILTHLTKERIF